MIPGRARDVRERRETDFFSFEGSKREGSDPGIDGSRSVGADGEFGVAGEGGREEDDQRRVLERGLLGEADELT